MGGDDWNAPLFWGATPLWALLTALLLRRGLGLGLIGTPWRIVRKNGSPAGFWRCLARQILFLVYLAANLGLSAYLTDSPWVFPLLWPTLGPLVVGLSRLHRNWYDIVTGFVFTDQPAGMPAPRTGSGDAAQAGAAAA